LKRYGIAADQVVIEVTESRLMEDRVSALETLTRITLAGLQLSIDDFGTGYSSLSQVAALPFSELKVDGSFVQKSCSDKKAKAILLSTVTLGRTLGMTVVAEGVETFEQLDLLRQCETSMIQGYLIARPMSSQQLIDWLHEWRPGTSDKPGCTRQLTLLIVDDSASVRGVIAAEMAQRMPQAKILTAASGDEALVIAEKQTIDAATLDFHMPGVDGLELLLRLRNKCPSGRYVLLTADHTEAIAQKAIELGALYCPKPMTSSQIDRIVRYFMDSR
jgi:CheY-like chemotaxis protein